ncbi:MAG: tail fiber domain-containing protein [Deltaproteobacteria bacterium]|nr:tail fiber domain-containing protein [Deltaproteobacteria bacterium]
MRKKDLPDSSMWRFWGFLSLMFISLYLMVPVSVLGADKLIVKNESGTETFKVSDSGSITSASSLLSNGAGAWGSAPFVLGQNLGNRGMVITDKATSNQKNIYFGWNVGASHDYAELFALQEGVAYKNFILNPNGGHVGIGTTSPSYPLQMGSGAYVSSGGVWTNASSRELKTNIRELTDEEAMDALQGLRPVKFSYKVERDETHVGFVAEDVPDLVASRDRKGMSSMDVVAVLTRVVQEQQKTIAELSRKVAELEKNIK